MTSVYARFRIARDAAWNALLDFAVDRLPVPLSDVTAHAGIRTFGYSRHADLLAYLRLAGEARHCAGLAVCYKANWIILFDDGMPLPRVRFTVAHELGHIFMGHVTVPHLDAQVFGDCVNTGDLESNPRNPDEQSADMFAARFLAPAVVLWALDIHTPEDIAALTGLSWRAALHRAHRMETLYARNEFLTDPPGTTGLRANETIH